MFFMSLSQSVTKKIAQKLNSHQQFKSVNTGSRMDTVVTTAPFAGDHERV